MTPSRNPFGTRAFQSGDARPAVLGALFGVAAIGGVWFAASRGISIPWTATLVVAIGSFFAGLALLLLKKRHWSARRRWTVELLGACLTGPVCVLLLTLGVWPLPVNEVGDADWSDGVGPSP